MTLLAKATVQTETQQMFSLFDATVADYLEILSAVGGFLEKSRTHFLDKDFDLAEIVETRLAAP